MDKQTAMLQALWQEAYESGKPQTIEFTEKSEAERFRFAMYKAVKDARSPTGVASDSLREAVTNVMLSLSEDKLKVTVQRKTLDKAMDQVAKLLGNRKIETDEEKLGRAMAERLEQRLGEGQVEKHSTVEDPLAHTFGKTPYYTREPKV